MVNINKQNNENLFSIVSQKILIKIHAIPVLKPYIDKLYSTNSISYSHTNEMSSYNLLGFVQKPRLRELLNLLDILYFTSFQGSVFLHHLNVQSITQQIPYIFIPLQGFVFFPLLNIQGYFLLGALYICTFEGPVFLSIFINIEMAITFIITQAFNRVVFNNIL